MLNWFKRLLSSRSASENDEALEALRLNFKRKYKNFTLLLAANKKTLELMTEMEQTLAGKRVLGMPFIRSRSTRIATNVFKIIRHLEAISGGKYEALYERFKSLQDDLSALLVHRTEVSGVPLVLPIASVNLELTDEVGGKMAALGELSSVPGVSPAKGFVMTAAAYQLFVEQGGVQDEINRIIQTMSSETEASRVALAAKIEALVVRTPLPESLEEAITREFDALREETGENELRVAMRSSAIGEDSEEMSFAGQYDSILGVDRDHLVTAYKRVLAGKYSAQAMSYRAFYGIRDDDVPMCVGCMPMVDAAFGGVVYTTNPLDNSDDAVSVFSVNGLPKHVVDGSADVDSFVVSRESPPRIRQRELRDRFASTLDDETIVALAARAMDIESHFGAPQDIEWAVDQGGAIVFLQSRPLTERLENVSREEAMVGEKVVLDGGITASRGVASGRVRVARGIWDVASVDEGVILVTTQPLPVFATVLGKVAAICTEQGSIACHLANVAREFHVPALFTVRNCTQILRDGATVTVDADNRRIYAGEVHSLLTHRPTRDRAKTDSPVFTSLKAVTDLILPLRLLDPNSESFTPENCRTFHDMTRFCHEKAVFEMFNSGAEPDFPRRAGRRLFTDVATQFWIIDLDDGLIETSTDPYFVKLTEVVSIPMLALWQGMASQTWEGPPSVDTKGFFQIVAESTMDTNLNANMPSDYGAGNHIMVARNYCSLQTRFGYHFATVEALVGNREMENYVSFHFGGGGAGEERKNRRARLILSILEEKGFVGEVRGDRLEAHIGGFETERMESALHLVGFLLVHTRQIDMVMTDDASMARYRDKLLAKLSNTRPPRGHCD